MTTMDTGSKVSVPRRAGPAAVPRQRVSLRSKSGLITIAGRIVTVFVGFILNLILGWPGSWTSRKPRHAAVTRTEQLHRARDASGEFTKSSVTSSSKNHRGRYRDVSSSWFGASMRLI